MSLKDLRTRINSIKSTSKTTKAMYLISASQMTKIKQMLVNYKQYKNLMGSITSSIAFASRNQFDKDLDTITVQDDIVVEGCQKALEMDENYIVGHKNLVIIISGEKGLCGSFNASVVNSALNHIDEKTDVLCIGKKGYEILSRKRACHIIKDNYIELHLRTINSKIVMGQVTKPILHLIASNKYANIKIVYTEFISMLKQEVVVKQIFPVVLDHPPSTTFEFDSKPVHMLRNIIPQYLHSLLYNCVLNSIKSETVKRMMTMDNATTNSKDMLHKLNLDYNRARQTKVTMELIEVISGMQ